MYIMSSYSNSFIFLIQRCKCSHVDFNSAEAACNERRAYRSVITFAVIKAAAPEAR